MKRITILYTLFFCHIIYTLPNTIIIRPATLDDLSELLEFDKTVSYEYFVPIWRTGYQHLPLGKNPTYYLEQELEIDKTWFPACINSSSLWIAYDHEKKSLAGFVIAHQTAPHTLFFDLLLVAKQYRRMGIGKSLIQHVLHIFDNITLCELYTLKHANEKTLAFYHAMGFVTCGEPDIEQIDYGMRYKDLYYRLAYTVSNYRT